MVERILDSKQLHQTIRYLVQLARYRYIHTSWEPGENLATAKEQVYKYHRNNAG